MIKAFTPSVWASIHERLSAVTDLPSLGLTLATTIDCSLCRWLLCRTCVAVNDIPRNSSNWDV